MAKKKSFPQNNEEDLLFQVNRELGESRSFVSLHLKQKNKNLPIFIQ